MTAPLPSSAQPISGQGGFITPIWQRFFNSLLSGAEPIATVTPTASPFAFTAPGSGNVLVSGGTVSAITFQRGNTTITTGATAGYIPVASGDIVTVTYSVVPTAFRFIPN